MRLNNYIYWCFALLIVSTHALASDCKKIRKEDGTRATYINRAGSSCLTYDIYQPQASRFNWESGFGGFNGLLVVNERECKKPEMAFNHFQYTVNLQAHSLSSESKLIDGVFQRCFGTTINLRNGTIFDVKTGVLFYKGLQVENSPLSSLGLASASIEDTSTAQTLGKRYYEYINTHHIVEAMNINATYRGVNIHGNKNVIRNSIIEVDGHTAIYMAGSMPVIENNTIIIHGKGNTNPNFQKDGVNVLKGAIKLRDAKGAIIRNNKIIYKGGFFSWGKAPVAINLLDSKDVLIENNTIVGFEKLVRENGDTNFMNKNNKFEH